jgi:hypothetical protein
MRVTGATLVLVLFLAGCESCERREETPGGGAAGSPAAAAPTAERAEVAPPEPTAFERQVPPETGEPGPDTTAAVPSMPPADDDAAYEDDGDCIVIGDATPDYGSPPLTVEFSAEAECSSGEPTYKWDFGDGSPPASGANVAHTYTSTGDFVAVITVTGPDGSKSDDEIDVTVEDDADELE